MYKKKSRLCTKSSCKWRRLQWKNLAGKNVSDSPVAVGYTFTPSEGNATNYKAVTGTISFTITPATPTIAWDTDTTSQSVNYTGGAIATDKLTSPTVTGVNSETLTGSISYSYREQDSSAAFTSGLPTDLGTYEVKASIAAAGNYTSAETTGNMTLTIDWLNTDVAATLTDQNNNTLTDNSWWAQSVTFTAPSEFSVCDRVDGTYGTSFYYATQTDKDGAEVTYYLKNSDGEIAQKTATVRVDLTGPTWPENGGICIKNNWWKTLLNTISFGLLYKDNLDVKASATDDLSGVAAYYYYVDETGSTTVLDSNDLANKSFTKVEGAGTQTLTSLSQENKYVVYAYAVDAVGNKSDYVCTNGVVLDKTAPIISNITTPGKSDLTLTDVTAKISFTGSEAGTCFYMISASNPSSIDDFATSSENDKGMTVWTAKDGVSSVDMTTEAKQIILDNLSPNTAYTLYLAAVDQAGNSSIVYSQPFTTCKTMPTITINPSISGTYGQQVAEMTLTNGVAKVGSTVITGTWELTDSNETNVPSVGTTDTYQVTFTPVESYEDKYEDKIVEVKPTVVPRSLTAEGISISEVNGSFTYEYGAQIKPGVTVNEAPDTGASGIYVTDSYATITTADIKVTYSNNINAGTAKVTLTGQGNYTGTVERTFTIDKAAGKNIATMNGSYTDNGQTYTYTVEATADGADVSGLEYLMLPQDTSLTGSETWQTSNVFTGITPNTDMVFYARMKATSNNYAGTENNILVNFAKLTPPAPTLNYTVDDSNPDSITLTIVPVSGAEYSFDGGSTFTDNNSKAGFVANETINLAIRMKETDTHNASSATSMTVTSTAYDITVSDGSAAVNGITVTKGYPGQTVTVTAASRSGYNVTGWTVVSGDVTLSVSTDKKTATFMMPNEDVSLRAEYQKYDSGSSGGSTDSGNDDTDTETVNPTVTPAIPNPVINPIPEIGNNTNSGIKPNTNIIEAIEAPFIKGENGKEGWDVIRDEVNQTQEGEAVTVIMNGSTVVPGDVLNEIKGKDITIVFDMGNGITWSINGQSITSDRIGDIDFTVKTGTNSIPVDVINNVTGERFSTQISLAYDGEFGFTAVLSINLEADNAGLYANLFYYNEKTGELEFICYDEIAEDGTVELKFTHASDYAIVIDTEPMDVALQGAADTSEDASGTSLNNQDTETEASQNGAEVSNDAWNPWWVIIIGIIVIVIGVGVFFVVKKKKSENE